MTKTTYFASDVHLGAAMYLNNAKQHEATFVNWLNSIQKNATALYFLGDLFDFWFEYKSVIPKGFTRSMAALAKLTDAGISVHFFPGNHDLWIKEYLTQELGIIVHPNAEVVSIENTKFFLAHGDGLDPQETGYLLLQSLFKNKILQRMYAMLHPDIAMAIAKGWSSKSRLHNTQKAHSFKNEQDPLWKFAQQMLLKDSDIKYFVFGHHHLAVHQKLSAQNNAAELIILGDWLKLFTYGAFSNGVFELCHLPTHEVLV